jgi:hypothetical protein
MRNKLLTFFAIILATSLISCSGDEAVDYSIGILPVNPPVIDSDYNILIDTCNGNVRVTEELADPDCGEVVTIAGPFFRMLFQITNDLPVTVEEGSSDEDENTMYILGMKIEVSATIDGKLETFEQNVGPAEGDLDGYLMIIPPKENRTYGYTYSSSTDTETRTEKPLEEFVYVSGFKTGAKIYNVKLTPQGFVGTEANPKSSLGGGSVSFQATAD